MYQNLKKIYDTSNFIDFQLYELPTTTSQIEVDNYFLIKTVVKILKLKNAMHQVSLLSISWIVEHPALAAPIVWPSLEKVEKWNTSYAMNHF